MRFASIDGHELFSSRSRCCAKCLKRKVTVRGKEVIEYYHRIVVCHLVGFDLALPLDLEPILPGEGEVIAAKRLQIWMKQEPKLKRRFEELSNQLVQLSRGKILPYSLMFVQ